jgi:serine/threonine protein kinase/formylglycine-generating enzyme required for sulfatase activity/dienelactone hydrolase
VKRTRWDYAKLLLAEAAERPAADRERYVIEHCEDPELRQEILELLAWPAPLSDIVSMKLRPGTRLGPYVIERLIGRGGMGDVYHCVDSRLGRNVAIKVLPEMFATDRERAGRFKREARVLASLNHPHICTLLDVGSQEDVDFLVLEYLDGETLADRLCRGPLDLNDTIRIALQIADALDEAHRHGLIHRDIKPANIFLTARSGAKILDFGLAKGGTLVASAARTDLETTTGAMIGTAPYMSPEQLRGLPVDQRTDLFSFGVVLHEMLTGERPFTGSTGAAIADSILHEHPRTLANASVPASLGSMLGRLLAKDPASRPGSAKELLQQLRTVEVSLTSTRSMRSKRVVVAIGAVALLAVGFGGWEWHRSSRQGWALETAIPEVTRLVDAGEFVKAAALAGDALTILPTNPTLMALRSLATGEVSIASVPSEAEVSFRSYGGHASAWQTLGKTPVRKVRVGRSVYVWKVVKPGFAPAFFIAAPPASTVAMPPGAHDAVFDMTVTLRRETSVPPEMVVVPAGRAAIEWSVDGTAHLRVDEFLIDRFEVTNGDYKKFVDAGGYQNPAFWKQPFVRNGQQLSWQEAVTLFRDTTRRSGPSTWEAGGYPRGREKHPVAGVSWYEAAAYAEFAGKSLPTAYHWTHAAQAGLGPMVARGGNFLGEGTQAVGSQTALSGFGTSDMAGNVKEWTLNEGRDGKRTILGGGFGEPTYMFYWADDQSPWDRRSNFGFRLARFDSMPSAEVMARVEPALRRDFANVTSIPPEMFEVYRGLYAYDNDELNARVEERETGNWRREKVTFDAAYGDERVIAHVFLPRNVPPPFQAVVFFPGGYAFVDEKPDLLAVEYTLDFILKSGRAVIFPVYKSMYERRDGFTFAATPASVRDHTIMFLKDLSRTLDYLATREDIDASRVAYSGYSAGAQRAPILLAIERRFKAAILSSGGFQFRQDLPEADAPNFTSRVTMPVLMLNGRYDSSFPLTSTQLPFFNSLGTPAVHKKHVVYEDGHAAFFGREGIREVLDWLDKYLGPVKR